MITWEDIGLLLTGILTFVAFWLIRDIHKDSKSFYKKNKP